MSLYVIADLHLSLSDADKSMDVFGRRWTDYIEKLKKNWCALISEEDTVVIPGDISWAFSLSAGTEDFAFLNALPGRKLLSKGNHDFWWATLKKNESFFKENGWESISFFQNNAYLCEDFILAATRGWFADPTCDKIPEETDYEKLTQREAGRLRLSLTAAKSLEAQCGEPKEILVFLHFPPVWNGIVCQPLLDVLQEFGIRRVFFGHVHGNYMVPPSFMYDGIQFALISADFLNFCPRPILPTTEFSS